MVAQLLDGKITQDWIEKICHTPNFTVDGYFLFVHRTNNLRLIMRHTDQMFGWFAHLYYEGEQRDFAIQLGHPSKFNFITWLRVMGFSY